MRREDARIRIDVKRILSEHCLLPACDEAELPQYEEIKILT